MGCGSGEHWLCRACLLALGGLPELTCPGCGQVESFGLACAECQALGSPLDQLVAGFSYEKPVLHKLLWSFKESSNRAVLPYLSRRLAELGPLVVGAQAVVPVPTSRQRLRERGFNQASLLAKSFAKTINAPLQEHMLVRTKIGRAQKSLDVLDRHSELKGVFNLAPGSTYVPKTVVLVDDIATTLATLETCAMALRQAGVQRIVGLVLAHAQR